ncbi:BTB/POZ domain-containing protein At3g49900 [Linum grandiflorum]
MTSLLDSHLDQNLADITDSYFNTIIVDNRPLVLIVLNAALRLLPESETAAGLVSRCLESLDLNDDGGGNMSGLADNIMQLRPEEFIIVAESIQSKLNCHDELYLLVDLYIRDHGTEMSEEDKTEMCNRVDCDKLSPQLLIHAVQNHRLPLRFIVRAMLMEQLNTRRAILTSGNGGGSCSSVTIGSILRRDEAVREAGQIKAEMESTSMRIKGLEKEIKGMKKRLVKSEEEKTALEKQLIVERWDKRSEAAMLRDGNGRSASFHYCGTTNKVERGERGSVSFGAVSRVGEDPTKKKQGGKGKKTSVIGKLKSKLLGFQLIGSDCRPQP